MPASYFLMTIMQTNYKSKLFKDDLNVILNKNTIKKNLSQCSYTNFQIFALM